MYPIRSMSSHDQKYQLKDKLFRVCMISIIDETLGGISASMILLRAPTVAQESEGNLPDTLDEKLAIKVNDEHVLDYLGDDYPTVLNRYKAKIKLKKFKEILTDGLNTIETFGSMDVLHRKVERLKTLEEGEKGIFLEQSKKRRKIQELKSTILSERRQGLADIANSTHEIGLLKDEIQNIMAENTLKLRYVIEHQNSHVEQAQYFNDLREESVLNEFRGSDEKITNENIIYANISEFYEQKRTELRNLIEQWMEKHETDVTEMDDEINLLTINVAKQNRILHEDMDLYEERKAKIEEYLAYKEKKRLEAEELERKHKAATSIQAWWRGCMVRHFLGPYRKRKGKNKKKNKNKKDKKKK